MNKDIDFFIKWLLHDIGNSIGACISSQEYIQIDPQEGMKFLDKSVHISNVTLVFFQQLYQALCQVHLSERGYCSQDMFKDICFFELKRTDDLIYDPRILEKKTFFAVPLLINCLMRFSCIFSSIKNVFLFKTEDKNGHVVTLRSSQEFIDKITNIWKKDSQNDFSRDRTYKRALLIQETLIKDPYLQIRVSSSDEEVVFVIHQIL